MLNTYKLLEACKLVEFNKQIESTTCLNIVIKASETMLGKLNCNHEKALESYAVLVSTFLHLGLQKGWSDSLHDPALAFRDVNMTMDRKLLEETFLEVINYISSICLTKNTRYEGFEMYKYGVRSKHERYFKEAWILILALGFNGFSFTVQEIENAYFKKSFEMIKRG